MSGGHSMESTASVQEARQSIREEVRKLCQDFPDRYWQDVDKHEKYPQEFVDALTESGYLAALIPEEYGGAGLGITEASIILEEINRSGGNSAVCHAQMYTMGTLLRHGSEEQKGRYLPSIAQGKLRLQAFAVTEPNAGSETTRIETRAVRKGDRYIINGQKIFISRAKQSDLMLLLARTTPYEELTDKTQGLSVFLMDMRNVKGNMEIRPLDMMVNHHTNTIFLEDVEVPVENRIGAEANMAKLLASEAAWEAANVCLNTYGGYGFARDYDVERKFRETRLLTVAPVSNNLVLAFLGQNVLGMPKSY